MAIEKTFDPVSPEILKADEIFGKRENFPEVVVGTFTQKNIDMILEGRKHETVAKLDFGQEGTPVYKVYDSLIGDFAVFYCHLGGAAAAAQLEELISMGGRKFIVFGSCGCLVKGIEAGSIVVPTEALRDEGVSYHYLKTSDFVELKQSSECISIMESAGIRPFVTKAWTTDALYRETEDNVKKRKEQGCEVVDMECASLAAVAEFRNVKLFQFFYIEDNLDGEEWDPGLLGKFTYTHRKLYTETALEIVKVCNCI